MLNDDTLKSLIEAIVYVSPEPVTLETLTRSLEEEDRERVRAKVLELMGEYQRAEHGIHIRQVAGGYQFSSKPEHHDVLRKFVKSLKPPIRLSKPALEALAVIAYRQPVTLPEINEIRGVDSGGVIGTLLDRKLITTAGRKQVIGRPILYKTTKEFLMRFGLKDINELPSMEEFEKLVAESFQAELLPAEETAPPAEVVPAEANVAAAESEPVSEDVAEQEKAG